MKEKNTALGLAAIVAVFTGPLPAFAGESIVVRPMQVGEQTIRYRQGVGTVEQITPDAVVDVTPLGFDHGALTFALSIFNASSRAANIDITDVSGDIGGEQLRLRSTEELIKMAKSRAMWSQIGVALLAGAAAGVAASQQDQSSAALYTPRGTYRYTYSQPSVAGQIAAVGATVGGVYAIDQIQKDLDATLGQLGDGTLQLNTIDPGHGFAARLVFVKPKKAPWPQVLHMTVRFNGAAYNFDMDIGKSGRPVPVFAPITTPVPPAISASPLSAADQPAPAPVAVSGAASQTEQVPPK